MKKVALVATIIFLAIVLVLIFGQKKTTPENTTTPTPTNANTTNTSESTDTPAATVPTPAEDVTIENNAFSPKVLTVKKGTKVTWTNKDSAAHNVIFDDTALKAESSGTLNTGGTYSHTFDTVGTFTYVCSFHAGMTGSVVVTD